MIRHAALVVLLAIPLSPTPAAAHCDTTRGPVVTAARAALDAGNPDLVLHWVRPEDETAVKAAFQQALAVRVLGPEAKALADRSFFETLVRIHRAGEGAPYTGLSDRAPEPIIAATDKALERGDSTELEQQLVSAIRAGLAERFSAARAARDFRPGDIAAGRAYVAAYVPLTHWVEGVFAIAHEAGEHHAAAADEHHAAAADHHAPPAAAVQESSGPTDTGAAAETHGPSALRTLPWILAGLLAIAAAIEGAFLVRRRHRVPA